MSCEGYPTASNMKLLATDAQTINEVVTSAADLTTPASDGLPKTTLTGIDSKVADAISNTFSAYIGDWSIGLAFNAPNEYAVFNGVSYKPKSGTALPYVAQGADPTSSPDVEKVEPFSDINTNNIYANAGGKNNEINNPQFIVVTPDAGVTPPSATPTSYVEGEQIFSGWFVGVGGVTNLTYVNGLVNADSGVIYYLVPNTGALESLNDFTASAASLNLKPSVDGVSYTLDGDNYKVELDLSVASDVFSAKFEVGLIPTGHGVDVSSLNTVEFNSVADMQTLTASGGVAVLVTVGQELSTGSGRWEVNDVGIGVLLSNGLYSRPIGNIFVRDFGLTDANLDEAITLSAATKLTAILPFQTVTYTEQHSFPAGANLKGAKKDQYSNGFGIDPLSSTILFEPTTTKSLFVADGTNYSGFRFHNSIRGMFIKGNANSVNAIQLNGVIYGAFKDLSIVDFDVPVICDATINNLFENVYLTGREHSLVYAGNSETTDTWNHCSFWGSAIGGINFIGSTIAVRFIDCLFEQCGDYAANLAKECQNIMFQECYSEDVPYNNNPDGSVFRVGYDGSVAVIENNIQIIGGKFAGRNLGITGFFLDCDDIQGAQLYSANISRFVNPVRVTANTKDNAILTSGCSGISWTGTTFFTGQVGKIQGSHPNAAINAGGYGQVADYIELKTDKISPRDGSAFLNISPTNIQMSGTSGTVYPGSDSSVKLGLSNLRWNDFYVVNAPIVGSDARIKQEPTSMHQELLDFAMSVEIQHWKFKDGKRNHSGIVITNEFLTGLDSVMSIDSCAAICNTVFTDDKGNPVTHTLHGVELGDLWQVRHDEWQNILLEAMRRKINHMYGVS